ncbi:hypothetical protein CKAH01_16177 [Colletotrichum kahawae]|uniref:Uncharacterized protein n=1 Tax=Colletotrichum kahawae TaxID=34407 RepID=A0AAD9YEJ8_COLKA|nr:hypothetical protein CKAH01_16177 [Colletotrichum kahawae]
MSVWRLYQRGRDNRRNVWTCAQGHSLWFMAPRKLL